MDFSKNKWSWQELLFALENNLISRKDIIKYAIHTLDEGILGFDIVLKIAIADDFNSKTEEVYADFGYPEDMAGFIRYMPLTEGKSMEESWQSYLISAKKRFENK